MTNMKESKSDAPHIAVFPSAGMGHLTPFLRIAATLLSANCRVTLITARPTVSAAESAHISSFLSQHPQVKHVDFQTIQAPYHNPTAHDPFFLQMESTSCSVHLLYPPLASSSPPLSAIFADLFVAAGIAPVAARLGIPHYLACTTAVKFVCLLAHLPDLTSDPSKLDSEVEIPGLSPLPSSSIPPVFKDPDHIFTRTLVENSKTLSNAKGIIVNSFDWLETETIEAVNGGRVLGSSCPPVLPIGPLEPYEERNEEEGVAYMAWLKQQPAESVVFVSFGSRTALSRGQITELAKGLERCEQRFLWVIKSSKVDKEDEDELKDLVKDSFLERTRSKGMAVKGWVSQQDVLEQPSVGAFVSHCGWNSVTEAARRGVPVVAWPQHGDQMMNAEVVERAGLGLWERKWCGGAELVSGEEIGEKIREVMVDEKLRKTAKRVGEEARKATGESGSSRNVLKELLESLH